MQKANIGVIGAGTMGTGIAQVTARQGNPTVIFDVDPVRVKKASENLKADLDKLVQKQKLSQQDADNTLSNIQFAKSPNEFADCDLIIEGIIENLELKQKVFNDIEKVVDAECILATNTSSLSITSIASVCNKPQRVIGIHFFNPAPVLPLVEIIPGLQTVKSIIDKTYELVKSWGKMPVIAKDTPGFIVNRIARPFYGEAIRIYEEGIADVATIDKAMKDNGFKMGPFELMDLIGIDVNYAVTESVWKQMYFDPRYKPSLTQKRLCEAGKFGKKTGSGFYNYNGNVTEVKASSSAINDGENIFMRIISMLINEAVDALYLGIASREDIETAMTKGTNYPKGLLQWCDEIGAKTIYNNMIELREYYHEDRYRPSPLLQRMS